jgi:hypothetical protein
MPSPVRGSPPRPTMNSVASGTRTNDSKPNAIC